MFYYFKIIIIIYFIQNLIFSQIHLTLLKYCQALNLYVLILIFYANKIFLLMPIYITLAIIMPIIYSGILIFLIFQ